MRATGAKMRLWPEAFVPTGGPLLGAFSGPSGMAALAFRFGAVLPGPAQVQAGENRGGPSIGFALVAGGAFTVVDAGIWMLSGAQRGPACRRREEVR
jgi:hypothetical protein